MNMPKCPYCGSSENVILINPVKKRTGFNGEIIGTGTGIIGGKIISPITGRLGMSGGRLIASILKKSPLMGGLIGYGVGIVIGIITLAKLGNNIGKRVDNTIQKYRCKKCGIEFDLSNS